MADGNRSLAVFQFKFSAVGEVAETEVLEVSGLTDESDVVEHKVVTDGFKEAIEKVPGRRTGSGQITISRAITPNNKDFWTWREKVVNGAFERVICSVEAIGIDNTTVVGSWTFEGCWPSKIEGPEFDTEQSQFVQEKLTIAYEYFRRDS